MKILLTGAAGTVGYATLLHLIADNRHDITIFDLKTRRSKRRFKSIRKKVRIVYGNIANKASLRLACKEQDVIIHLAAIIPPEADDNPILAQEVNILGTKNLIDCAKEGSPKAFFIYGSSISVYGDRLANPYIRVGDPLLPSSGDHYAITKITAEKEVENSGLDYSILRITAVMGANNHKISKLMFHMPLDTPIELVTPHDAGCAFANAIEQIDKLKNQIFNLSGGKSCQVIYRDFIGQSFINYGLGLLDFPEHTFATKNFHCGYYADGDKLEEILKFRSETLTDFYRHQINSINPLQKYILYPFRGIIKRVLWAKSEPLQAHKDNDTALLERFIA